MEVAVILLKLVLQGKNFSNKKYYIGGKWELGIVR